MNIRTLLEYIPFLESLITFLNVFPLDNVLYGIMSDRLEVPDSFRTHLQQHYGYGTRTAWIRLFEWALDAHPFLEAKFRMHETMHSAGLILRYRTFIRDYQVFNLKPEGDTPPPACCFPFFCKK